MEPDSHKRLEYPGANFKHKCLWTDWMHKFILSGAGDVARMMFCVACNSSLSTDLFTRYVDMSDGSLATLMYSFESSLATTIVLKRMKHRLRCLFKAGTIRMTSRWRDVWMPSVAGAILKTTLVYPS